MNHFKLKIYIVCPAYVTVFFLLLTFTHAWAGDTADPSSSAKTDETFEVGEATGDAENDAWEEEDNWDDDEWEEGDTIADPFEPLNRVFFHFSFL